MDISLVICSSTSEGVMKQYVRISHIAVMDALCTCVNFRNEQTTKKLRKLRVLIK